MELHHPIMSKLWDLGGQTKRINRYGIKPDKKKVQGITHFGQPTTTSELRLLIVMVQLYIYMWTRKSHLLAAMTEASVGPKSRKVIYNDVLEDYVK